MNLLGTIVGLLAALFYGLYDYMSIGDASIYNPMVKTVIVTAIVAGILSDIFRYFFSEINKSTITQK